MNEPTLSAVPEIKVLCACKRGGGGFGGVGMLGQRFERRSKGVVVRVEVEGLVCIGSVFSVNFGCRKT